MKLNLGCGSQKIKGYVNIDVEKKCRPDLVCDFIKKPLPYKPESVDQVLLFHTIEHIQRRYHRLLLWQIWRILKPGREFLIAFPEFRRCFQNCQLTKMAKSNSGKQQCLGVKHIRQTIMLFQWILWILHRLSWKWDLRISLQFQKMHQMNLTQSFLARGEPHISLMNNLCMMIC